jgi:hypothetical protein
MSTANGARRDRGTVPTQLHELVVEPRRSGAVM